MRMPKMISSLSLSAALLFSAEAQEPTLPRMELATDKACYLPGEMVHLTASGTPPSALFIRYRHGAQILAEVPYAEVVKAGRWSWRPPRRDFQGYLVEVYTRSAECELVVATIAVDVSSDWRRFPRYGFVADFDDGGDPAAKRTRIAEEMAFLNRCHINGVQFQDWQWKHHYPAPLDAKGQLMPVYRDVSNRWVKAEHVRHYIELQHRYGMKSIFYNLCFGSWKGATEDGVQEAWALYAQPKDAKRYQDFHGLPSSWQSNIYLLDPGNADWQRYLCDRNDEVYRLFDFDGYQIDQLGSRGPRYDATGREVHLPRAYASFIKAVKKRRPEKRLIMNAVSGYGDAEIIGTGKLDFCYNEVWGNGNGYGGASEAAFANLYEIIKRNDSLSRHRLPTVFAAYLNYDKADHGGRGDKLMNTPGVLLTDAVMFALGGSHLELGDHMLSREYFPAAPLVMSPELRGAIVHYYDFLTAYQNWLRGTTSRHTFTPRISTTSADVQLTAWPPKADAITAFAKQVGPRQQVVHLLNFLGTNDLSWRDVDGTRPEPRLVRQLPLQLESAARVVRVWAASPDLRGGAPELLPFTQRSGVVSVTLPALHYWTMLVLELAPAR